MIAAAAALGAVVLATRRELQRYLMIRRAAHDPSVVGVSITPQGNELALGRTDPRGRPRQRAGRPLRES